MSQNVADFLLQRLREWGVKRIYGYPGDGINAIMGTQNVAAWIIGLAVSVASVVLAAVLWSSRTL